MNKPTNTWLFEILCEPIPASMQSRARQTLLEFINKELTHITNSHTALNLENPGVGTTPIGCINQKSLEKHNSTNTNFEIESVFCTHRRLGCILKVPSFVQITIPSIKGPKTTAPLEHIEFFRRKHAALHMKQQANDHRQGMHQQTASDMHQQTQQAMHQQTTPGMHQQTTPGMHQQTTPNTHQQTASNTHQQTTPNMHQQAASNTPQQTTPNTHQQTTPNMHQQTASNTHQQTTPNMHQQTTPNMHQQAASNTPQQAASNTPQQAASNAHQQTASNTHQQAASNTQQQAASNTHQQTTPNMHQQTASNTHQQTTPNMHQQTASNTHQQTTPNVHQQAGSQTTDFIHKEQDFQLIVQNDTYFTPAQIKQVTIEECLSKLAAKILHTFQWPKSMRWMNNSFTWVRPILNVINMINDQIIQIKLDITPSWTNTNTTINEHNNKITINHANNYLSHFHFLQHESRANIIDQALKGLTYDKDMIPTLADSVQVPHPFLLDIKRLAANLPVLYFKTCVEEHQQAVCVYEGEKITHLLLVAQKPPTEKIKNDCKEVIKCRVEDMKFIFDQDIKEDHNKWLEQLKFTNFYQDAGTIDDKIKRLYKIHPFQETLWFKADLASLIVKEFPTLALEHIQLIKPDLNIINNHKLLALDALDSLIQLFLQKVPINSSQDPLGLKKLANQVIEQGIKVGNMPELSDLIDSLQGQEIKTKLIDFLQERMKAKTGYKFKDFWKSPAKAQALKMHDLTEIEKAYKRICNFIKNKDCVECEENVNDIKGAALLIQQPLDLAHLDRISHDLNAFFDTNMVLDPEFLGYRIKLLERARQLYEDLLALD